MKREEEKKSLFFNADVEATKGKVSQALGFPNRSPSPAFPNSPSLNLSSLSERSKNATSSTRSPER